MISPMLDCTLPIDTAYARNKGVFVTGGKGAPKLRDYIPESVAEFC